MTKDIVRVLRQLNNNGPQTIEQLYRGGRRSRMPGLISKGWARSTKGQDDPNKPFTYEITRAGQEALLASHTQKVHKDD